MKLLAEGHTSAQIAARMDITTNIVNRHFSKVLTRLDLQDLTQLAVVAYRSGLVRPGFRAGAPVTLDSSLATISAAVDRVSRNRLPHRRIGSRPVRGGMECIRAG
jgi:Bacterial regulatory proteins, luxR family